MNYENPLESWDLDLLTILRSLSQRRFGLLAINLIISKSYEKFLHLCFCSWQVCLWRGRMLLYECCNLKMTEFLLFLVVVYINSFSRTTAQPTYTCEAHCLTPILLCNPYNPYICFIKCFCRFWQNGSEAMCFFFERHLFVTARNCFQSY